MPPTSSKTKQSPKKTEQTPMKSNDKPEMDLMIDYLGLPLDSAKFYSLSGRSDSAKEQLADAIVKIEMESAKARTIKKLKQADTVYWLTDKDRTDQEDADLWLFVTFGLMAFVAGTFFAMSQVKKHYNLTPLSK
jgi:hypothetical protein